MKTFLITCLSFLLWRSVSAQVCQEEDITDSVQVKILADYYQDCIRNNYLVDVFDGIIKLSRFPNPYDKSILLWKLEVMVADDYKRYPTTKYDIQADILVLIYDGKSDTDIQYAPYSPELINCLDEIVGDRVYTRPKEQLRWVEQKQYDGKWVKEKVRAVKSGNNETNVMYIFFRPNNLPPAKARGI